MQRVNQMRFYRLGRISQLATLEAGQGGIPYETFFEETFSIGLQLEGFIENEEYKRELPRAVEKALSLRKKILDIWNGRRVANDEDIHELHFLTLQFEASLDDELQRLHTYKVEPVGAHSFDRLVGAADMIFPENLRKTIIPEQASSDFRSAGRCLAFDLPTACGFHAFRATDAMLRKYCKHFDAVPSGNSRDWGTHIRELRTVLKGPATKKPNERTVELIDSIRAQDRNPLVHPELNLDSEGALLMFDLCKNAVSLMATDIKNSP